MVFQVHLHAYCEAKMICFELQLQKCSMATFNITFSPSGSMKKSLICNYYSFQLYSMNKNKTKEHFFSAKPFYLNDFSSFYIIFRGSQLANIILNVGI